MKPRQLIVWLVLVAVAATAYILISRRDQQQAAQKERAARIMALDDPRLVASLEISGSKVKHPIKIERRDKEHRWALLTPVKTDGDGVVIGKVAATLMTATVARRLSAQKDLAPFGLDPPHYRLKLVTKDGVAKTLLVGKVSPTREYVYAALPGSREVLLLPSDQGRAMFVGLFDLRSKSVLDFVVSDVVRLELQSPGQAKPLVLVRKIGGARPDWRFKDGSRVDPEAMVDLLYQVHGLQAVGFEDPPFDPAAKGLESPRGMVVMGLQSGQRAGILIGKKTKDQQHSYVRRLSGGSLMVVKELSLERLRRKPEQLAYRRPWELDRRDVVRLTVQVGKKSTTYARPEGRWVRTQPPGDHKSGEAASLLVWDLANLHWQKILPAGGDYGLVSPRAVIVLTLQTPAPKGKPAPKCEPRVLKVGKVDPASKLLAIKVDGDDRVFGVKPELIKSIPGLDPGKSPRPGQP